MIERMKGFRFRAMYGALAIFLLMAAILFMERMGINMDDAVKKDPYLPRESVLTQQQAMASVPVSCLVLTDLGRDDCADVFAQFQQILLDMKVAYDSVDLGSEKIPDSFAPYRTMIVLTPDMEAVGDRLIDICDWVKEGGRAMFAMTFETNAYTAYLQQKIGITNTGEYVHVEGIYFDEDFFLGGGRTYPLDGSFDSSLALQLRNTAKVHAWAEQKGGCPLIWSYAYGDGKFVVDNVGIYEKAMRGVYSASYTLLEDAAAYPVLNSATIFLDDMPSPVPEGDSDYITRDYNISVSEFYSTIWFRDIQKLSEKYGLPLVGLIIENYEDDTDGNTEPQKETERFSYFGNLILRSGGELGYHGYNHQPLCLGDVDYKGLYDYHTWPSVEAIDKSFSELRRFSAELYPRANLSVYVPPSNILSADGREYLSSLYPAVRTISGSYLSDDTSYPYVQEFGVAEDGIVELPRITSGSILDNYMRMAALSELNCHMVFTHFIHPDDAMDIDRGADLGWPWLYANMDGFFDWLVSAAPAIRRLDSAHLSATIQRWSGLTLEKTCTDQEINLHLGNFVDEAYLFVRLNEGTPGKTVGGELTPLTGTLYLLDAKQADITIEWNR